MLLVPRLGSGIPLVARTHEMRRLRAAFARAERGEAGAVLLSGDAGVGKTRLLTALGEHVAACGGLVLTGRCIDVREGGLPYLPFAEALAPLGSATDPAVAAAVRARPALGRLLPQGPGFEEPRAAEHPPMTSNDRETMVRPRPEQDLGQLQLFDAVLGVLTEVAESRPVVILLEDLHWADASTRNLLSFLLTRLRAQRLLVVGSYREEDVHRRHPLRGVLAELVRLATVEHVDLRPFGAVDARKFVEALADEPLPSDVVADIVSRSEGNPFFAEELLATKTECNDLPAGLAEVLLSRLERLSPDARRVARVISVANEPVMHAALAEVSGLGELELDDALREAVQHHVLVVLSDGSYTFRHALLQEAVYGDLLPGERSRTHAAYAARIKARAQGRGHDAKLAYHSMQSSDLATALPALLRAMDEAEKLGAPGSALQHVEQALSIWDAVTPADRPEGVDELKLLYEASYFAGTSGEPERAAAFARSATQALTPDIPNDRAAKVWRRLADALLALEGTLDEAVAAIDRAWDLVKDTDPSSARAWVLASRAGFLRILDQPEAALDSALTAVADAQAVGATGAEASALVTLGTLADSRGDAAEARERLRQAQRKARDVGAYNTEIRATYFLALSHDDQGEFAEALEHATHGVARAEEAGLSWSVYGLELRARQLMLRYLMGDWPDESAGRAGRGVSNAVAARILAIWSLFVVARGRSDEAAKLLSGLRQHWTADMQIPLSAGGAGIELAYWHGDHADAVRQAEDLIGWLERIEPGLLAGIRVAALGVSAAAALAAAARLHGDQTAAEAAVAAGERLLAHGRMCAVVGQPRSGTLGPEGRAWLARLEAAATCLSGRGDARMWAAAAEAFGYGAVYEQAICRWHEAEALLAADTDAGASLEAAHEVAVRLGAIPLRDAVRDLAHRARVELDGVEPAPPARTVTDPLTDRERDVLERVALGRTNRQVGEELYISEKTVSVHLSRVMAKLGASRRAEAVAIAYDRGLLTAPTA
ncbi:MULTISPECIES: helix-turn-helix transcriptional regulator [Amycolatopsis]|uniref:LuxR family transcriptional regulator n=1 Tax=Amycolatopsis bullii TaxID=941987 RepID=A0ABQ3KU67_9PSEU|nr:helix-turn-helix transcriptional regulator [Amycolatopsis bullii]GHG33818.1 LuxR family transcriptional regulator [Amycolatopsis bullii]